MIYSIDLVSKALVIGSRRATNVDTTRSLAGVGNRNS